MPAKVTLEPFPDDDVHSNNTVSTVGEALTELWTWYVDQFGASADLEDTTAAIDAIVRGILDSDDPLAVSETTESATDIIGRAIRVERIVSVSDSDFGGVYARILVTFLAGDRAGEQNIVSVGSPNILAQLKVLHEKGRLPVECRVTPVAKAKPGKNPALYLRPLA